MVSELCSEIQEFMGRISSVQALAGEYGTGSSEAALSAVYVSVPSVVIGLARRAEDSAGIVELLEALRTFDTSELESGVLFSRRSQRSLQGPAIARQIFGIRHASVVSAVAEEANVSLVSADGLVGSSAWAVCATLAQRYGRRLDRQQLLAVLTAEQVGLEAQGWGFWFRTIGLAGGPEQPERVRLGQPGHATSTLGVLPPLTASGHDPDPQPPASNPPSSNPPRSNPEWQSPGAPTLRASSTPDSGQGIPPGDGPAVVNYPPPVSARDRFDERSARRNTLGPHPSSVPAPEHRSPRLPRPARPQAITRPGTYGTPVLSGGSGFQSDRRSTRQAPQSTPPSQPAYSDEGGRRFLPLILAALVTILGCGIAYLLFIAGDGDGLTDAGVDNTDVAGPSTTMRAADVIPLDGTEPALAEPIGLTVPLSDTANGTERSGLAELNVDTVNGEICYYVTTQGVAVPYEAFINHGAIGTEGPVVAELGHFGSPQSGCFVGRPIDIQAMVHNLDQFYIEMVDGDGNSAVRGQLSAGVSPEVEAILSPTEEPPTRFAFLLGDTGASVSLEDGRLTYSGRLESDEVAALFADRLSPLADALTAEGIELVNELESSPDAPAPSGRINVIDGISFASSSAVLADEDLTILDALAALAAANPEWTITVVGHTDGTGPAEFNTELSAQRAESVVAALVERGVAANRLSAIGAGSSDPIDSDDTEEGRSRNRRLEFRLSGEATAEGS